MRDRAAEDSKGTPKQAVPVPPPKSAPGTVKGAVPPNSVFAPGRSAAADAPPEGAAHEQPVSVPLLGFSQMEPRKAQVAVLERLTSELTAQASAQVDYCGGPWPLVERRVQFPGREMRYSMMVFGQSRAARVTDMELGTRIGQAIDGGLTSTAFWGT